MKRTIFALCLIAIISATGAVLQSQAPPPTQMQKMELINAEKENKPHSKPFAAIISPQGKLPDPLETKPLYGENLPKTAPKTPLKTTPLVEESSESIAADNMNTAPTNPTEKPQPSNTPTAPTQTATKPSETATPKTSAPKMGDKRTVDGENQMWIDGFGWIKNEGGGGCGTFVEGMGEVGNKVGIMGGESAPTKKAPTPYEPAPGEIVQELIPTPTKNSTPPDYKPDNPVPENPRQSQLDPKHGDWDKIIGY